jgi:hypothetical protein
MTQRCAEKCVAAAQDLIALVDESSQTNAAGAWWYGIFCEYLTQLIDYSNTTSRHLFLCYGLDISHAASPTGRCFSETKHRSILAAMSGLPRSIVSRAHCGTEMCEDPYQNA